MQDHGEKRSVIGALGVRALFTSGAGLAATVSAVMGAATTASAQGAEVTFRPAVKATGAITDTNVGVRTSDFVLAPIPFSNSLLGTGLTLGAAYLFTLPNSKPSGIGGGYMATSNGSRGYGLGGSVNFGQGKWTLALGYADAEVNYDLPVTLPLLGQRDIALTQSVAGWGAEIGYSLTEELGVSLTYAYVESDLSLDTDAFDFLPDVLQPDAEIDLSRFTLDLDWDTRDDTFYPTSGVLASVSTTFAQIEDFLLEERVEVSDRSYIKNLFSIAGYRSVGEDGVLAAMGVACGASEDAPFFDTCGVGFVDGARGFSPFDYLNSYSASLQVAYRDRFTDRLGFVVFADVGGGGDTLQDISYEEGGVAAGAGIRFRLSKQFALDYSVDYAVNNDGDGFLYLYLGQRF